MRFKFPTSHKQHTDLHPENWPERLVWWSIVWIYPLWLIGALYLMGSLLSWLLLACVIIMALAQADHPDQFDKIEISPVIWIWIIGMMLMQAALIAGHADFNLDASTMIKSSIGWAKGWAALALYPLAGCLKIRSRLISRAICIVGLHTVIIAPILLITPYLHLPQILFVSPLRIIGGPGNEFFDISLYEIDGSTGELRWRLFTPWGPALGFIGNVNLILSLHEQDRNWKTAGMAGAIMMCLICKSRLSQVCIIAIPLVTNLITRIRRPITLIGLGAASFLGGLLSPLLLNAFSRLWDGFKGARAGSTRVRFALKRIAIRRWEDEAPIWGHGIVEPGPHLVEAMPIGSHHTWAGLLFVKGIVGFCALVIPMAATIVTLIWRAAHPNLRLGSTGLSIAATLLLYTFGENLEILVYLYWPGMIMLGLALQEKSSTPTDLSYDAASSNRSDMLKEHKTL